MKDKLDIIYKYLRAVIFITPVVVLAYVIFLILFPVEKYSFYSNQPDLSKFNFSRQESQRSVVFGVLPLQNHQVVDLSLKLDGKNPASCAAGRALVELKKTYKAFLYPDGNPIENEEQLKNYLFRDNDTKYPSGTLLHLAPTNEVYLVSDGKKILFPGPEIFRAFGYSFDNLVEAEKSTIDLFPDAENKVFLWTQAHPDGAIFQAFPSHKLFLIADGKKHEITSSDLLTKVWPEKYAIPVSDPSAEQSETCAVSPEQLASGQVRCRFLTSNSETSLGGYYNFSLVLPAECPFSDFSVEAGQIKFSPEKSFATVKDSLRTIFASILNRYITQRY